MNYCQLLGSQRTAMGIDIHPSCTFLDLASLQLIRMVSDDDADDDDDADVLTTTGYTC